jgi:hypothetical protein
MREQLAAAVQRRGDETLAAALTTLALAQIWLIDESAAARFAASLGASQSRRERAHHSVGNGHAGLTTWHRLRDVRAADGTLGPLHGQSRRHGPLPGYAGLGAGLKDWDTHPLTPLGHDAGRREWPPTAGVRCFRRGSPRLEGCAPQAPAGCQLMQRRIPHISRRRPPEAPASARQFPQDPGQEALLTPGIPAYPRSARKGHDRPVTPEVAGSSPVAPAENILQITMFCCQGGRERPPAFRVSR